MSCDVNDFEGIEGVEGDRENDMGWGPFHPKYSGVKIQDRL